MFRPEHGRTKDFTWPEGTLEACDRFQQGDVIETASLAFSYDARFAVTPIAREYAVGKNGMTGARVDLRYAMITSQTCDLGGRRAQKYPLVLLAPVYNIVGQVPSGQDNQIRNDLLREYIPLDGPRFAGVGELWVADLRFETAFEKGVLVDRDPIDAFSTDEGYLRCRRKVGRAHFRPAPSENVHKYVLEPLREQWESGSLDPLVIRDFVMKATPKTVAADAVRLFIVVREGVDVDEQQARYDEWYATHAPSVPSELQFLGIEVRSPDKFTWADFEGAEVEDVFT